MILPLHVFRRSAYSYDLSLWFGGDGSGVGEGGGRYWLLYCEKSLTP